MATWTLVNQDGQPAYVQEGIGWGTPTAGDWINAGEGNSYQFAAPNPMLAAQQGFSGIGMNAGALGMMNPSQMGQAFGMPYFKYQNNQWTPGWGEAQGATSPLQKRLLELMPERVRAGGTVDPVTLFGPHSLNKTGAGLALALHDRLGKVPGVRNPVDIAQEYVSSLGQDMGNTAINTPGLTYQQVLRNYLGQEPLASRGVSYDALNQGGKLDALVQAMNQEGLTAAQKRNEQGKKSGFGGMVKGWATSPGGSLLLGSLAGPVLGHAFNPAVSGPMSTVGQAVSDLWGSASGMLGKIPGPLRNAVTGAAKSALTGGNPLTGALSGGIGGLGGMAANFAGLPPELGSMLAKQGLGMYRSRDAMQRYLDRARQMQALRSAFPQRTV